MSRYAHQLIAGTVRPEHDRDRQRDPGWLPPWDPLCKCGFWYLDHDARARRVLLKRPEIPKRNREWWRNVATREIIGVELEGDPPVPVKATPPVPPLVVVPYILLTDDTLNWITLTPEAQAKLVHDAPAFGVIEETPESTSIARLYGVLRRALAAMPADVAAQRREAADAAARRRDTARSGSPPGSVGP